MNYKKKLNLAIFLFIFIISKGQDVRLNKWLKHYSNLYKTSNNMLVDNQGNIYISGGYYNGSIDLDPGPGTYTLTNNGSFDIFIAKYNNNGQIIWGKGIGGSSYEVCNSMYLKNNQLYLTGRFKGSVDFDPNSGNTTLTSNNNSDDIFISKLDTSGNHIWSINIGGVSNDEAKKITMNPINGNITVCGGFNSTCDFDPGNNNYDLTSNGGNDAFFANYTTNGTFVSAYKFGAGSGDVANSIDYDENGGLLVAGKFYDQVDFDVTSGQTILTANFIDGFVAYYNPDFTLKFVKQIGGKQWDEINDVKYDPNGYIVTCGKFKDTCVFDASSSFFKKVATGEEDGFLFTLLINGSPSSINVLNSEPNKITSLNRIFVTLQGHFASGISNSNIKIIAYLDTVNLAISGQNGIIVGFDINGSYLSAENYSYGSASGGVNDFYIDNNKDFYVLGDFNGNTDFEPTTKTKFVNSGTNIFFGKYNTCTRTKLSKSVFANIMGDTICKNNVAILQPNSTVSGMTLSWYAKDTGNNYLGGFTYVTPRLSSSKAFYLQDSVCGLTERRPINVYVSEIDSTVDKNGVTLTASASSSILKYQWINCDNQMAINGATSRSFTPNNTGNYAVIITDTITKCSIKSNCSYVVSINKQVYNSSFIRIYPNPANHQIRIENNTENKTVLYEIYDVTGKIVKTGNINSDNSIINVSEFYEGVYYVKFIDNNYSIKFVKIN